jgi:hypothetical protein
LIDVLRKLRLPRLIHTHYVLAPGDIADFAPPSLPTREIARAPGGIQSTDASRAAMWHR